VAGKFYATNNVGTRLDATCLHLRRISRSNIGVLAVSTIVIREGNMLDCLGQYLINEGHRAHV
jgi:hypothetical protein